jgi:hypothetical protein
MVFRDFLFPEEKVKAECYHLMGSRTSPQPLTHKEAGGMGLALFRADGS